MEQVLYVLSPEGRTVKSPLVVDGWGQSDEAAEYDRDDIKEHVFDLRFAKVSVEGVGNLQAATVQLYLDDTSNFDMGLGNTRFLRMRAATHGDGSGSMHMAEVRWPMCGVMQQQTEGDSEGGWKVLKMPDVGKVVVTGEAPILGGKHTGFAAPMQHGVIGGTSFPLKDMLKEMKPGGSGMYSVPIYNSFIGTRMGTEPLARVVFHRHADIALQAPDPDAKFTRLFTPSSLPNMKHSYVITHLLPPAINDLWADRIDQVRLPRMPTIP